jgi:hypothetical protein
MKTRLLLSLPLLSSLCGAILGCDETIQTTIYDGLETGATDIVTSLITAIFLALEGTVDTTTIIDASNVLFSLLS